MENSLSELDFKTMLLDFSKKIVVDKPSKYQLIFSRYVWEMASLHNIGYSFTPGQLDIAEKSIDGFIGEQNGALCYLSRPIRL